MAYEVLMPQLGLTMEEGTVSQWIKHEGDEVKTGDVIVEITTDKLTNEVASEHDGVMLKIVAQEGEDIPVKGLLCYIGQPGEAVGDAPAAPAAAPAAAAAAPAAAAPAAAHSSQNPPTVSSVGGFILKQNSGSPSGSLLRSPRFALCRPAAIAQLRLSLLPGLAVVEAQVVHVEL